MGLRSCAAPMDGGGTVCPNDMPSLWRRLGFTVNIRQTVAQEKYVSAHFGNTVGQENLLQGDTTGKGTFSDLTDTILQGQDRKSGTLHKRALTDTLNA